MNIKDILVVDGSGDHGDDNNSSSMDNRGDVINNNVKRRKRENAEDDGGGPQRLSPLQLQRHRDDEYALRRDNRNRTEVPDGENVQGRSVAAGDDDEVRSLPVHPVCVIRARY